MKHILFIIFLSFGSWGAFCQESNEVDSLKSQQEKVSADSTVVIKKGGKEKNQKKDGFGDTLLSLGKGFLDRLKYRFNLEAIEEKVERTKERLQKEDKKNK